MIYVIYILIAILCIAFFALEIRSLIKDIREKKNKKKELLTKDKKES